MRREFLVSFLLVASVVTDPPVSLDDPGYVFENPYVRDGLTAKGITRAFTGVTVGNWHPLTMLSLMLDCQLFGGKEENAGWHHLVNLALHAANTLLLFLALRRMTGALWRSALVAALFGLHPLHVESVAWISERKDVLSTLFFMLTLLAYHRYAERPNLLRYAAVFVSLALGLTCKPMLVTTPFVLLLLDYWPLDRMKLPHSGKLSLGQLIAEKTPLFVLVAASALLTYVVQQGSGAMGMLGQDVSPAMRIGNAIGAYGQYLEKTFWPSPLSAIYPYVNRALIDVLIIGVALAAISAAAVRLAKILPFLFVGWFWFLGTLVPVIGLVQVGMQSIADRYAYIPSIGVFIIAAWGGAELAAGWPLRNKAAVVAVVLAACGWFSRQQLTNWSSSEALYRHAVAVEPLNLFARHELAMLYWKEGKLGDAQKEFEDALKTQSDVKAHVHGGQEPLHRSLGLLLAVRGQPASALEQLDKAIQVRPQQPEPYRQKAWILATSLDSSVRDGKKAVEAAESALQFSAGKPPEYWDTLAAAQAEDGLFKEAVESEEKALARAKEMGSEADDLVPGIEQRLGLFKQGIAYRAKAVRPQRP
jgi:protein O-mannosyl-transferase